MFQMKIETSRRDRYFGMILIMIIFLFMLFVIPVLFLPMEIISIYSGLCTASFFVIFGIFTYIMTFSIVNTVIINDGWITIYSPKEIKWKAMLDYLSSVTIEKGKKRITMKREDGEYFTLQTGFFNPEDVIDFIDVLKEASEKHGFIVVDEETGETYGRSEKSSLQPEISEEFETSSIESPPYEIR